MSVANLYSTVSPTFNALTHSQISLASKSDIGIPPPPQFHSPWVSGVVKDILLIALDNYIQLFPYVKFWPTGGIGVVNFKSFLELKNVISVGGSWLSK